MERPVWMKIDLSQLENPPKHLRTEDECYFLREYTAHGGYNSSEGNQDVDNFKKKRETENTAQCDLQQSSLGWVSRGST
jgi:hypothetical protein